ncbi:MAG: class I SAM-dependent methyltransferase family protein, partial [Candidatus Nanoarchaeia archaeon]
MTTLREALKGKIPADELALVPRSYDVVGNILIFSSLKGLKKRESLIATTVLELYKNIKTVAVKSKMHSGLYRTKKIRIIGGAKNRIAEYKENNARLKMNIEKVYFSPRMSTERKRIMELCKKGESVLVMFSGIAPYCCVIAKNKPVKEVYGIEINKDAHKYA